jgi:hypothetical protein
LRAGARLDAVAGRDLCIEERAQRVSSALLLRCVRSGVYLPRDVFFTFADFFAAFAGWSSPDPAASALSFCFRVAMSTIDSAAGPRGEPTIVSENGKSLAFAGLLQRLRD